MIAPASALGIAVMLALGGAGEAATRSDAGDVETLSIPPAGTDPVPRRLMTLRDAPTTSTQAFTASSLTALAGVAILAGLALGPSTQLPMGEFTFHARLGTALLLLSVGPSMGDLMNHDLPAFIAGAAGRTLLVALGWGAFSLAASSQDPTVIGTSILFMTLAGLVWLGWGSTDLVRSLFAPERWVDRQNQQLTTGRP